MNGLAVGGSSSLIGMERVPREEGPIRGPGGGLLAACQSPTPWDFCRRPSEPRHIPSEARRRAREIESFGEMCPVMRSQLSRVSRARECSIQSCMCGVTAAQHLEGRDCARRPWSVRRPWPARKSVSPSQGTWDGGQSSCPSRASPV